MPLHYYSESAVKDPSIQPGWHRGQGDTVFSNPKFGSILHVAISNKDGHFIYDQPAWAEPVGAIIVPVDQLGKIAFVKTFRNTPPGEFRKSCYPPSDLLKHGRFSLELPRGFAEPGEMSWETAKREAEEETGFEVTGTPIFLGENNSNTTFQVQNIPIWIVPITNKKSASRLADPNEVIKKVHFFQFDEAMAQVKSGKIICGTTKSALLHYFVWRQSKNINTSK